MTVVIDTSGDMISNMPHIPSIAKAGGYIYITGFHEYDGHYITRSSDGGETWTPIEYLVKSYWINHVSIVPAPTSGYLIACGREGHWYHDGSIRVYSIGSDGSLTEVNMYEEWGVSTATGQNIEGSSDSVAVYVFNGLIWAVVFNIENSPDYSWAVVTVWQDNGDGSLTQKARWEIELNPSSNISYYGGLSYLGNNKVLFASNSVDGLKLVVLNADTGGVEFSGVENIPIRTGNSITVIGNNAGEGLILYTNNDDLQFYGVYYSNGAVGAPFIISPGSGLWNGFGYYEGGTVYIAMVDYYNRGALRKVILSWGDTTVTLDYWDDSLPHSFKKYTEWSPLFDSDTGLMWVVYANGSWYKEVYQYKTATPAVTLETVVDTIGFNERVGGSLGVGLSDNVGMIDLKSGNPNLQQADVVSFLENLLSSRVLALDLVDNIGVSELLHLTALSSKLDVVGISGVASAIISGRVTDSLTLSEVTAIPVMGSIYDAVIVAEALNLPTTAEILNIVGLAEVEGVDVTVTPIDYVSINTKALAEVYQLLADNLTLSEIINAISQLNLVIQTLAEQITISEGHKEKVTSEVQELLTAIEVLNSSIAGLHNDVITLTEAQTIAQIYGVTLQEIIDITGIIEKLTLNTVAVVLAEVGLREGTMEELSSILGDNVTVNSQILTKTVLSIIDSLGLPDSIVGGYKAVLTDIIPAVTSVVGHYSTAYKLLGDTIAFNEIIAGNTAVFDTDVLMVVDSVEAAKWLFARLILSLYSKLTIAVALSSIVNASIRLRSKLLKKLELEGDINE